MYINVYMDGTYASLKSVGTFFFQFKELRGVVTMAMDPLYYVI